MFNSLGWPEIVVLVVLGFFVFGPERLPEAAAEAGRALRRLRTYARGLRDELQAELGPEIGELDLRSLNPREFVRQQLLLEDDDEAGQPGPKFRPLAPSEPAPWDPDTT